MSSEINPNHPLTDSLDDHWHKLLAMVMYKCDIARVVISPEDVEAFRGFFGNGSAVIAESKGEDLHIYLAGTEQINSILEQRGTISGKPQ